MEQPEATEVIATFASAGYCDGGKPQVSHAITLAVAIALLAAGLHAGWNVLLKTSGDPLDLSVRAVGWTALALAPVAAAGWVLGGRPEFPAGAWVAAGLSGGLEVGYFLALSEAYRRGDLSVVYPIARGTAALLIVLAGFLFLGERLGLPALLGVLCLLSGMLAIRPPVPATGAITPAILTGLCISMYTMIDKIGVGLVPPWLYGWAVWTWTAILLLGGIWLRRRTIASISVSRSTVSTFRAIGVGMMMVLTYLLVLSALSLAPVVVVAPVRESAIVLVAVWGVWRLNERQVVWQRLGGALAVVGGIILVAVQ